MSIRIAEGADPLSEAARQSPSDDILVNAQSEAGRLLRQELLRYCRGEINGRSFLVAGHRGAGKTTMVADAVDRVLRQSRRQGSKLLRPLPVFLHGPSLFEIAADDTSGAPEGSDAVARPKEMADQAKAALTQIILGLHRAVVSEFARAYRTRVVASPPFRGRPAGERKEFAELAAQFEVELMGDPSPSRLREFWAMAEAVGCGVLGETTDPAFAVRSDAGALELVAVSGMCEAYQRISGETSVQKKSHQGEDNTTETRSGLSFKGAELVSPLVSVLSGVAVAGGTASQVHNVGGALLAGLATALTSSLFFSSSTTRTVSSSRQADTTFIPDLTLRTLDRVLPTLLQRLREAGLAPVLVVDELDKVDNLKDRLAAMIHYLKKLVAENVFTCFLTDRGYLEQLRLEQRGAYDRSYSYFSHALLMTFQPADLDGYLGRLLWVDLPPPQAIAAEDESPDGSSVAENLETGDGLDAEVLKWVLRHRCELHPLSLTREISRLRDEGNAVLIQPGVVRTEMSYRIALTFQVAIELQLAQPNVSAWLKLHPERSQTLIDALYFASRVWMRGDINLNLGEGGAALFDYLAGRMNLDDRPGGVETVGAQDDRQLLLGVVSNLIECLSQATDESSLMKRWENLPSTRPGAYVVPTRSVVEALLLGEKSLIVRVGGNENGQTHAWRYSPSGLRESLDEPASVQAADQGEATQFLSDDMRRRIQRIREAARILSGILRGHSLDSDIHIFDQLAEQFRVLPTTPAWQPVSAAIANLELSSGDTRRRAALVEDEQVVREFLEMLDANASAVICSLTMAGFCAGAGEFAEEETPIAMTRAMQLLSSGLGFAELDRAGICAAILSLDDQARGKGGASVIRRDASLQLDDPQVETEIESARLVGKTRYEGLSRQEKSERAWEGLKVRLNPTTVSSPSASVGQPLLSEFVAGAARVGPWRVLGINLNTTTLSQWTTALMVASELTREPVAALHKVPRWIYGPALERLGSPNLRAEVRASLLSWLMENGKRVGSASASNEVRQRDISDTNRFALCVTSQGGTMRQWTKRPRTGLAFVVTREQAQQLAERGLFGVLPIPTVIAVSDNVDNGTLTLKVSQSLASRVRAIVVLNRDHRGSRPAASIVDPSTPDDVLELANAYAIDDARAPEEVMQVRAGINVFVEPRPKTRSTSEPIAFYAIELADGSTPLGAAPSYPTQQEAIDAAKSLGYRPLTARVRRTDKNKPDQWRAG